MQDQIKTKIKGIAILGYVLIVSNFTIIAWMLFPSFTHHLQSLSGPIHFFSLLAVFPLDVTYKFQALLSNVSIFWISSMIVCAVGILNYNNLARVIFIILNLIHISTLVAYVVSKYSQGTYFLDSVFVAYFNLVASVSYIGFLTIPEIRELFHIHSYPITFEFLKRKPKIRQLTTSDASGFYNLGRTYSQLKRYQDAINSFLEAIRLKPNDAKVYYNLGVNYLKVGSVPKALDAFKEVLRVDSRYTDAFYQIGLIYVKQGCDQEAVEAFQRANQIEPHNPDIQRALGTAYFILEDYAKALEAFKEVVRISPGDFYAHYKMGLIYSSRGERYSEAVESFKRAVRLKSNDVELYYHLGMTYVKLKRHKDAIRAFKEVIRRNYEHKQAHYNLGVTYALIEDFQSAQREYKILKAIDTDLANTLSILIKL